MRWRRILLLLVPGVVLVAAAAEAAGALPHGGLLSLREVNGVKATVAVATTALLSLSLYLEASGRRARWARPRDGLLAVLGVLGVLCWWNLLQFNYPGFGHASDTFHYYLGAKYFPELGYDGLYRCTLLVDQESARVAPGRRVRDLDSNTLVPATTLLEDPGACRARFSEVRWRAFGRDVEWLRERVGPRRWTRFHQDHGYNATPAWTLLGHAVTSTGPATSGQLLALQLLDPLLLLLMWAAVIRAFGWRIAALAAVFWGTHYLSPYGWTGGSILRQDWLVASVLGICLLRRRHPFGAGLAFGTASLLRVFPALLLVGIGLGALFAAGRGERPWRDRVLRRLSGGVLASALLLLSLSALAAGGLDVWWRFAENSRLHLDTPLENHAGLQTVLSHDPAMRRELARDARLTDPMQPWKQARRDTFEERRALFVALVILYGLVVARAACSQPAWVGATLGVTLIPIATQLTGYYWSVLLALAFLAALRPWVGPLVVGLAALGWWIGDRWQWTDEIHVWISVFTVAWCVLITLLVTPRPRKE